MDGLAYFFFAFPVYSLCLILLLILFTDHIANSPPGYNYPK